MCRPTTSNVGEHPTLMASREPVESCSLSDQTPPNWIGEEVRSHDCSYIAVGRLTHIRDRMDSENDRTKRQLHNRAFRELQEMFGYKAIEYGIRVEEVNLAFSLQTCSKCGHQSCMNRDSDGWFSCNECWCELDGDYNVVVGVHPAGSKKHRQMVANGTRGQTFLGVGRWSARPDV